MPAGSGVARFKIVISATRDGVRLDPSLEALPAERRRDAQRALDGELAATLLIADRTGLERMRGWMRQMESETGKRRTRIVLTRWLGAAFLVTGGIGVAVLTWALLR